MGEQDDAGHGVLSEATARLGADFRPRLLSGLAMGALAALFVFSGVIPFAILVAVVALVLGWEWARLVNGPGVDMIGFVQIATVAAAVLLAALGKVGLGLLLLPIGAILAGLLSLGRHSILSAAGVFYAGLPAVALIWLRSADPALGLQAVVFLIVVVVVADTGAFVAGRLVRGPKLWPRLSPAKTWSGFAGAVAACAIAGALFSVAVTGSSPFRLAMTGAVLAAVAQAGDLAQSALKRRFGAKDTGSLIPGHGGIMDRVDGLVAVAVVAGLAALAFNVHYPARALLLGF